MALYTQDSVERVKEAVDLVELVGARTELRRVGARHTGLCPFHDERTPSFSVTPEKGLYHCFGCGASGDAIGFVQAVEGVDFKEALELLADRYRVELKREREDPRAEEARRRRERLLRLIERTTAYYARYLWESAEAAGAREYLAARGLGQEVLTEFRVGYAPSAWDRVIVAARRDGFSEEEMAAAGLGQRGRQGRMYDRFRRRIVFPLADSRGRVLGFGARAVSDEQRPKYLNTAENEIYHKGRQLFGLDRARAAAAKAGRILAVEGYTDVLALHQAGIREAVAIMGTALTGDQMAELGRAAPIVFLALDADRSGQEAMLRASRAAAERGVELRVVRLPDGLDPAELVPREGADGIAARIDASLSVPEFEVRRVLDRADLESPRGRDRALAEIRPLIASVPEKTATRDELVRYVADRLNIPVEYLLAELRTPTSARPSSPLAPDRASGSGPASAGIEAAERAERAYLAMCLREGDRGREYLARLTDDHLSSGSLREVRAWLLDHFDDPLADLSEREPSFAALVAHVESLSSREPSSETALRLGYLQLELRRIDRALRRALGAGDLEGQRDLAAARESVRVHMDAAMEESV